MRNAQHWRKPNSFFSNYFPADRSQQKMLKEMPKKRESRQEPCGGPSDRSESLHKDTKRFELALMSINGSGAFQRAWRAQNNPAIKAAKKICLAAFPWILSLKGFPRFTCPRLPTIPLLAALLLGMAALVLMQTLMKEMMIGERYECR